MGGHLAIHEVSPYIYTGENSSSYNTFNVKGFPLGGVKYFLKNLTMDISDGMDIICVFDSRSFRKDIFPQYKDNRPMFSPAVGAQLDFLYEELMKCGIPCYKVDGLEGDDLVFNVVETYKNVYDKISIFSSDYDVTHNVDFNVYYEPVNSNTNAVTFRNFSQSVERGAYVQLNTISAYKVFFGCKNDNIPPFRSTVENQALYDGFCKYLKDNLNPYSVNISRDPRALAMFFGTKRDVLSDDDVNELIERITLIYPKRDESLEFSVANRNTINLDRYAILLSYCNDSPSLKRIGKKRVRLTEEELEDFRQKARQLTTGEYSADRGRPVIEEKDVNFELLDLREF